MVKYCAQPTLLCSPQSPIHHVLWHPLYSTMPTNMSFLWHSISKDNRENRGHPEILLILPSPGRDKLSYCHLLTSPGCREQLWPRPPCTQICNLESINWFSCYSLLGFLSSWGFFCFCLGGFLRMIGCNFHHVRHVQSFLFPAHGI